MTYWRGTSVVPRVPALTPRHLHKSPCVRQPFAEISGSIAFSSLWFLSRKLCPIFVCQFKGSLHFVGLFVTEAASAPDRLPPILGAARFARYGGLTTTFLESIFCQLSQTCTSETWRSARVQLQVLIQAQPLTRDSRFVICGPTQWADKEVPMNTKIGALVPLSSRSRRQYSHYRQTRLRGWR